jgi:hypothetical protein
MTSKNRLFAAALVIGGTLDQIIMPADAGPCTKMIARFEMAVQRSADNPAAGPTAAQSIGAQLGHQPTPSSVKQANVKAKRTFAAALTRAKTLNSKGKRRCAQALGAAEELFNP